MKQPDYKLILLLVSAMSWSNLTYAQLSPNKIDSLVENAMKRFNVAGVAVGIVKDGKVLYSKGYGVKSTITKEKVDARTQFAIASNSKAFTTQQHFLF
ncbi:serine hydrolase [Pedobacter sp. NJ-S-72]